MNKTMIVLDSNDDKYFTHYVFEDDNEGDILETIIDYNNFNESEWDMDLDYFTEVLDEILVYPVKLTFNKFTWDNRTAYTYANNSRELIDKVFSLDNHKIVFIYDETGTYINTSNHDSPMGFTIDIEKFEESMNETMEFDNE
jgi:hypothetical protein